MLKTNRDMWNRKTRKHKKGFIRWNGDIKAIIKEKKKHELNIQRQEKTKPTEIYDVKKTQKKKKAMKKQKSWEIFRYKTYIGTQQSILDKK